MTAQGFRQHQPFFVLQPLLGLQGFVDLEGERALDDGVNVARCERLPQGRIECIGSRDGSFAIGIVVGKDRVVISRHQTLAPMRGEFSLVDKLLHKPALEQRTVVGPDRQDIVGRPFHLGPFHHDGAPPARGRAA
jgi:hypothetical protein